MLREQERFDEDPSISRGRTAPFEPCEATSSINTYEDWPPRHCIAARGDRIDERASTRNRVRSSLSAFFAWAITEGFLEVNPVMEPLRLKKADRANGSYRKGSLPKCGPCWETTSSATSLSC